MKGLKNTIYYSDLTVSYEVFELRMKNCDPSRVVSTKEDCEEASEQLGLSFKMQMNNNNRHAGCYKEGEFTYFNRIIIPSDTSPRQHRLKNDRLAICKVTSTESKIISTTFSTSRLSEILF